MSGSGSKQITHSLKSNFALADSAAEGVMSDSMQNGSSLILFEIDC